MCRLRLPGVPENLHRGADHEKDQVDRDFRRDVSTNVGSTRTMGVHLVRLFNRFCFLHLSTQCSDGSVRTAPAHAKDDRGFWRTQIGTDSHQSIIATDQGR